MAKIFICTCVDSETAFYCMTADPAVAIRAVETRASEEGDLYDSLHESLDAREHAILEVEDGKFFWYRENDGWGGYEGQDVFMDTEALKERLPDVPLARPATDEN